MAKENDDRYVCEWIVSSRIIDKAAPVTDGIVVHSTTAGGPTLIKALEALILEIQQKKDRTYNNATDRCNEMINMLQEIDSVRAAELRLAGEKETPDA